jgi:FkbM family methyltransferase
MVLPRALAHVAAATPSPIKYRMHRARFLYIRLLRASGSAVTVQTRVGPLRWQIDELTSQEHILGMYEPYMQEAFLRFVRPGHVVLDVGAHVGFHALVCGLLAQPGGSVIAVEPHPGSRLSLERQLRANPTLPLSILPYALGSADGSARLSASAGGSQSRIAAGGDLPVELRTVDSLVADGTVPPPDVIKIDVEGHESEVLNGAQETLRTTRPVILCDYNNRLTLPAVRGTLSECAYMITPGPPIVAVPLGPGHDPA